MVQSSSATITGAHLLLSTLRERGTRYLFGVPGHGAYPIYGAITDFPDLTPVVGRHEQSSLFSALAYAWASGQVAVATSVPEAGLTNAATGLLEATWAQERLLFLIEENRIHRDIARSIARHYRVAESPEGMVGDLQLLFNQLEQGRPGAAILEVPTAVLTAKCEAGQSLPGLAAEPVLPSGLAEAGRLLRSAERVAILVGASASVARVGPTLTQLAEHLNAPVFVDGFAKGLVAEDHPLSLARHWTYSGPGEELLAEADLILVIGAPLAGGQSGAVWDPRMVLGRRGPERAAQQLLLVDWDDRDHGDLPARLRLYGHIPTILTSLTASVAGRQPAAGFTADQLGRVRDFLWEYAESRVPWGLHFFQTLRQTMPRDALLLLDSMIGLWLDRLFPAYEPNTVRFPFGTGTLGFGVPAAVGAKLACPEREVVIVAGDGAFLYNPQELATMMLYRQKLTVIIANDDCYGAIKHNMNENFGRATAYALANPDFIKLGQSFGMRALRLASPDDIGPALREALAGDRSTLIEVPLEMRPPRLFYS